MSEESYFTLAAKEGEATEPTDAVGEKRAYHGLERRRALRRTGEDRRQEVRFESGKEDRRKGEGRREDDHTPKFW